MEGSCRRKRKRRTEEGMRENLNFKRTMAGKEASRIL
jgi:hypothetical protein